jgi:hypothetical protein
VRESSLTWADCFIEQGCFDRRKLLPSLTDSCLLQPPPLYGPYYLRVFSGGLGIVNML